MHAFKMLDLATATATAAATAAAVTAIADVA
jgi:hypothetical protein